MSKTRTFLAVRCMVFGGVVLRGARCFAPSGRRVVCACRGGHGLQPSQLVRQLDGRLHAQLGEDVGTVKFHRARRDAQVLGNGLVVVAVQQLTRRAPRARAGSGWPMRRAAAAPGPGLVAGPGRRPGPAPRGPPAVHQGPEWHGACRPVGCAVPCPYSVKAGVRCRSARRGKAMAPHPRGARSALPRPQKWCGHPPCTGCG